MTTKTKDQYRITVCLDEQTAAALEKEHRDFAQKTGVAASKTKIAARAIAAGLGITSRAG
ncbi:hypothetical protein SAMN05216229_101268 [Geopseudomonas sagittaria]|uniref:Uncharacterized protein n=1 Tax=Geopseudomonas sagittaria TaxID=1135990 RepID=A0A1I5P2G5_9GAMM|nr:hypothetical protein [Pseudomonas sagittaria]SFP27696.1 hypothetical protein SAMN05216229_101268 [Pseudomonas sagittaria]